MSSGHDSPRAVIFALAANLGIAIAKFTAFIFTGSSSMLAEGIHSVADTSNQALLLIGRARSKRIASPTHQFGYGQESYFWAFLVAVVLFTMGALFSLYEGIQKFRHPHDVESLAWAIGVLLFAMVFEAVALREAVKASRDERRGRSFWRYIRETRAPENAVILLEDSAAEIGLVAAMGGITMTVITGDARFDAIGTMVIGVVLAVVAVILAIEMRSLLLGESASGRDVDGIMAVLDAASGIERVVDVRTMHIGPVDLLVAARLDLDAGLDADEAAQYLDQVSDEMRRAVPIANRIYLEPHSGPVPES